MSWIIVALLAYFLLAIANLGDKFLVDNVLKSSKAYAFVVCFMGLIAFIVAPWFLEWPGFSLFILNLANGAIFTLALWTLYEGLRKGEASKILVIIGGLTPVFSFILSYFIFREVFSTTQIIGTLIILLGVLLIIFLPTERNLLKRLFFWLKIEDKSKNTSIKVAIFSALFYSLYFIGTKLAYVNQPFVSSFLWTRLGAFLFALVFLVKIIDRREILKMFQKSEPNKSKGLVLLNQVIGSSGFVLQNYAIFLGSVVLVNALQGFQYALILILSALLSLFAPKLLNEKFSKRIIIQKSAAVFLIMVGIYFITF